MCCKIIIPSHLRHDRVLSKHLVNDPIICVAKSQVDAYKQFNPDCEIVAHPDDIIGLIPKRNWMANHFGELFMLDDDVHKFRRMYVEAGESQGITDKNVITARIQELHELAKLMDISLYGFSKNPRPMYFDDAEPFSLSSKITGCAYGVIKGENTWWNEDLRLKEDMWISCYIKHHERRILIDNRFNFEQKDTFCNAGGLSAIRNQEAEIDNCLKMRKYFGECIKLKREKFADVKSKSKYNISVIFPF